jgi:hypothetical protein
VFSTGVQSITATGITLTGTTYDADSSTITLTGDTLLGQNTTITAATTTFAGTLDSSNTSGPTDLRTLGITGDAVFSAAVGSTYALGGLTVSGTSAINGGSIATTGAQTYTGAVTLGADTTITSGGGAITFSDALDSDSSARNLTLTAGSGDITFTGLVGNANRLGELSITSAANVTANGIRAAALLQSAGSGTTTLNAGTFSAGVPSMYGGTTPAAQALHTTGFSNSTKGIDINAHTINLTGRIDQAGGSVVPLVLNAGAGSLTIGANAAIDANASPSLTGGGSGISIAANIRTGGGSITFHSPTNLAAAIDLDTGIGTGNITFSGTLDGGQDLTLTAGSGDITFSDTVGTTRIGALTINSANNVSVADGKAFSAASIEQRAGSGTTTFGGTVNTNAQISGSNANGIDLTGSAFTFKNTVTTTGGGAVAIDNSGTLTINSGAVFSLAGAFDQAGGGSISLGANITTADANITFDDAITLTNGVTLNTGSGAGTITFSDVINSDSTARALTLTAGTGNVVFNTNATAGLTKALASLTITGDNITLRDVTTTAAQTYTATGVIDTNSTYTSSGGAITFDGDTVINSALVIDTTNGGASGGAVAFSGSLDSQATEAHTLTLTAGSGTIDFTGAVGSATDGALGAVTIHSAGDLTADQSITAASFSQNAGTGTSSFDGALTISGAFGFTGNALTLNAAGNTVGGAMTVANAGTFTTTDNADLTIAGAFQQTGNGTSSLGANLTATGGIAFAKAIALTGTDAVVLATGGAAGQDITFGTSTIPAGITGSGQDLTLNAGSDGDISVTAAIGSGGSALGAITITGADQASFSGAIDAASFTQSAAAATGLTTFDGALNLSGAFDFTGNALTLNDSLNSGSTVEITNAGLLTTAAAADITATAGFTQNGAGSSSIAGDITTTDNNISFLRAVTLTDGVVFSTGSGAGDITFSSTLDATNAGSETLALTSGTGDITFSDVVGGTRLGAVTINAAQNVTIADAKAFSAASFNQATAGGGVFTLGGDLNTDAGAITIDSKEVALNANLTTTAGSTNGLVTIHAGVGDANGLALTWPAATPSPPLPQPLAPNPVPSTSIPLATST